MITVYEKGEHFYLENKDFLLTNIFTEVFFRLDAKLLSETNKEEYAIMAETNNKKLVALRKLPYSTLFYGDEDLVNDMVDFLLEQQYVIKDILCILPLGEIITNQLNARGYHYYKHLAMDYMICKQSVYPSNSCVSKPTLDDVDELLELCRTFAIEVHLTPTENKQRIIDQLDDFRIIKKDNHIVAMAAVSESTSEDKRIAYVYTRPEYRGNHLAKKVVANIVNETLEKGLCLSLNVDQANPISNQLYKSLGFSKLFSQAIFMEKEAK